MKFTVYTTMTTEPDLGYKVSIGLADVTVYTETFGRYEPGGAEAAERYATERFARKLAAAVAKEETF